MKDDKAESKAPEVNDSKASSSKEAKAAEIPPSVAPPLTPPRAPAPTPAPAADLNNSSALLPREENDPPQMVQSDNPAAGLSQTALMTKKLLDKKPKVTIHIPLAPGEKLGQAREFVSINGYSFIIMKGKQVSVPEPVANLVMNHLGVESGNTETGKDFRIDRSAEHENALT